MGAFTHMKTEDRLIVRPAMQSEAHLAWQAAYSDLSWTETNGPYFPFSAPSFPVYQETLFPHLVQGTTNRLVVHSEVIIGEVSCYWENEATRWLEAGITLYTGAHRGKGIGRRALVPWISFLFSRNEVARIGLTTWSGNPGMIRCGESIGFQIEGRLRKVRYYQGTYYDAVRLGVLREEWEARHGVVAENQD